MQSDRNSSKTETFHRSATYYPHVLTSSEVILTFARHDYGLVGVFRIMMRSLVQKLYPTESVNFPTNSIWLYHTVVHFYVYDTDNRHDMIQ